MPWPEDRIEERLHEDLLVMQENRGEEKTISFLEQELRRLRVAREYRHTHRELARLSKRAAQLDERLGAAREALEFYADEGAYEARNGKPSIINKDKGRTAHDALEAIGTETPANGEETD